MICLAFLFIAFGSIILEFIIKKQAAENERKQAEKKLQESEAHYRQLFHSLPYGGEILDLEGKIINCSLSTSHMLGYEMNELIGKHITTFVDADTIKIFKHNFPKLLKGEPISAEVCMVHKNGSILNILRSAQPILNIDEKVVGVLSMSIDITKRKQMEVTLIKN